MKTLFEEYGRTALVVVAAIAVLALLFVRQDFFGALGAVADINSGISHSKGENALSEVVSREKPNADFSAADLHIYSNYAFQPLSDVVFKDADGETIDAIVTSIFYCDSNGNTTEFIQYYNHEDDVVVLNPSHYSASHEKCSVSEFSPNARGKLIITEADVANLPGLVTVTYQATDDEHQISVERLTFVVDSKAA